MSSYEEKIIKILKKEKISFEREKSFPDLKRGHYRYDFYVHSGRPCLIEINGEQHYKYVRKFYSNQTDFKGAQARDRRKISYALAHNIPLYIIPYWEIDNLKSTTDIFNEKFRARDRWKNDRDWQLYQKFDKASKFWENIIERSAKQKTKKTFIYNI